MTEMGEDEALEALQRLGLSQYEAEVFVALSKLGTGTARDVDRITDVPRSQVYGAAESLEERGLVELQQSTPIQYRAVDLSEAKSLLRERFEREQDRAFEYLDRARETYGEDAAEQQEGVWTVQGQENVTSRIKQLISEADDRVLFGTVAELHDEEIVDAIRDRTGEVQFVVLSSDTDVREQFADMSGVVVGEMPHDIEAMRDGRLLGVDGDTVLLSVLGAEELPGIREETAIWSSDTGFSTVLLELLKSRFEGEIQATL